MNWKRIFIWSALIFVAAFAVGFSLGSGIASMIGVFLTSSTFYWLFLRRIRKNRFGHAIATFIFVEVIDRIIPLFLGAPLSYALSNWDSSARHMSAALLGLALASLMAVRRVTDAA